MPAKSFTKSRRLIRSPQKSRQYSGKSPSATWQLRNGSATVDQRRSVPRQLYPPIAAAIAAAPKMPALCQNPTHAAQQTTCAAPIIRSQWRAAIAADELSIRAVSALTTSSSLVDCHNSVGPGRRSIATTARHDRVDRSLRGSSNRHILRGTLHSYTAPNVTCTPVLLIIIGAVICASVGAALWCLLASR
jgi:hypothetical protein